MSEKSEKVSEMQFVSTAAEAAFLIRRVAEPRPVGDSAKAALVRVSRRLSSWSFNRVKDVWYGDQRIRISADELRELRRAARIHALEQEATHELRLLNERIARVEEALFAQAADMDRASPDEAGAPARNADRPLD
jgi:hypothetical protein